MATSSIFTNFVVDNEESVKIIAKAFEDAEKKELNGEKEEYPVTSPKKTHDFINDKEIV